MLDINLPELKTLRIEVYYFTEIVGWAIENPWRRRGHIPDHRYWFFFSPHVLKPSIYRPADDIRGYFSLRRRQDSDQHLRSSMENPFIRGLSTNGVRH